MQKLHNISTATKELAVPLGHIVSVLTGGLFSSTDGEVEGQLIIDAFRQTLDNNRPWSSGVFLILLDSLSV